MNSEGSYIVPAPPYWGLYIHVPFCRRKCRYCDFPSYAAPHLIPRYLESLDREIAVQRGVPGPLATVYLGGGTPSLLSEPQLEAVLRRVFDGFTVVPDAEITMEVNPEGLTREYLRALRGMGINRLSIGVQSLDDGILRFLGRGHTADEGIRAVKAARDEGFDNVCVDLIHSIPGQEIDSWRAELQRVLELEPEHCSLYSLTVEPSTPLGKDREKGRFAPLGEEEERSFFLAGHDTMEAAGYLHYEVSNFARSPLLVSRHNSGYWVHRPYLGLGPSAHSFHRDRRWWNVRSLRRYNEMTEAGRSPVEGGETLGDEEFMLETLYFGFRTARGLDLEDFERCFGWNPAVEPAGLMNELCSSGWVRIEGTRMIPTAEGMLRSDGLPLLWPDPPNHNLRTCGISGPEIPSDGQATCELP